MMATVAVPVLVGMPEISPVLAPRARPPGRPFADQIKGGVPFAALS